jgi:thioredoxin reductase (NADPH)
LAKDRFARSRFRTEGRAGKEKNMSSEPRAETAPEEVDPRDSYVRRAQTFPRLKAEQVERAADFGAVEALRKGTPLFTRGEKAENFFIVIEGSIEIFDETPDGMSVIATHEEHEFTGDLDLFNDRRILLSARMGRTGQVLRIRRAGFRRLLAAEPDIAETIMRAFILRRVGLLDHEQAATLLIGRRTCGDTLRLNRFLDHNGYPVRMIDPETAEGSELMAKHRLVAEELPAAVLVHSGVLKRPTNRELALAIGLSETLDPETVHDVAIVGAGPAGLAAAVYSASEGLCTVVLEGEAPGGQAGTSSKIENYLGFPTGISGPALAGRAMVQAQKFGARLAISRRVVRLDCDSAPYRLELDDGDVVRARSIVIATGACYRRLDLENFDRFEMRGIHYAATALEAALCEGEEVVVVGGGNSAGQAALYLCRKAARVHIIVRAAGLAASMSDYLISRIRESRSIQLHTDTEVVGLAGNRHLESVTWRNRRGEQETRPVSNLFLMLGAMPNTEWLRGCVALDDKGFVVCGAGFEPVNGSTADRAPHVLETSRRGVFAVGDVRAGSVKRVASAVGEGSIVVSAIHAFLAEG